MSILKITAMISPTLITITGCLAAVTLAVIYWLAVRADRAKLRGMAEKDRQARDERRRLYDIALNPPDAPRYTGYDIHGCAVDDGQIIEVPDDSPECKFFGLYGITPDGFLDHISDHPTRAAAETAERNLRVAGILSRRRSLFTIASKSGDIAHFRKERKV